MTDTGEEPSQQHEWYRRKIEEIDQNVRRRRRVEVWGALAHGVVLFAFGSLFGFSIQHHATGQVVISAIGMVAALATYWLNRYWYQLDPVRPINLSPILDRPSGEESGSGDV